MLCVVKINPNKAMVNTNEKEHPNSCVNKSKPNVCRDWHTLDRTKDRGVGKIHIFDLGCRVDAKKYLDFGHPGASSLAYYKTH